MVFLHIGAMKTGTTFLQQLLATNRDALAAAGFLFPGSRWTDQDLATRDVLGLARKDPSMRAVCEGTWDKMAAEMLTFDGRASIFSMEFLSFAGTRQAARVISSLDGAEVHVILTVRDAVRNLPAQWQTSCRNGGTVSWPTFARGARWGGRLGRLGRGQGARVFAMAQGVPRMLRAWGRAVPADHLHVVTVPPSGSHPLLLWRRFASVVGVDPDVCPKDQENSNPSLGQPSADLMRRVNADLGRVSPSDYRPTVKGQLAKTLRERSGRESEPTLDPATHRFALSWNRRVRTAIERSGAGLTGDLADLPVDSPPAPDGSRLSEPSTAEILAAAATARDGLIRLVHRRMTQLVKLAPGSRPPATADEAEDGPTPSARWSETPDPVGSAVAEVTSLVRLAIDLRRRLESARDESRAH